MKSRAVELKRQDSFRNHAEKLAFINWVRCRIHLDPIPENNAIQAQRQVDADAKKCERARAT